MTNRLKCVQQLSLKDLSLRKTAVCLWSHSDILSSISKFQLLGFNTNFDEEWREFIEDKIKDRISRLELPESLKDELIDIVEPIGIEIKKWKARHQEYFDELFEENCLPDSVKLHFTSAGMIDYERTAEGLVCCDIFLLVQRYRIACLYCLENHIPLLWEELSDYWKADFANSQDFPPSLPSLWPHLLLGENHKLHYLLRTMDRHLTSLNQFAFEHSVETGNKTAAEYFFQKLTNDEKESSLMRSTHSLLSDPYEDYFLRKRLADLLCFLLSVMTPEQQMEITEVHPIDVLLCFLDFPLQNLFSENSSLVWTFLPPSAYDSLLLKMSARFTYPGHYVPKLFQEFFIQSPQGLKKCFVGQDSVSSIIPACRFLHVLLESVDSESIRVVFRNLDPEDRRRVIFDHEVLEFFCNSILKERWHRVEICLREAKLSRDEKRRLKEIFMAILTRRLHSDIEWGIPNWNKFFEET